MYVIYGTYYTRLFPTFDGCVAQPPGLLLVLHCGCPIFTFCGLCTCGCHPFQQYPAVFCLLAFLNRWFGKLFFLCQVNPPEKVPSVGEYVGKSSDLPGLVGEVFSTTKLLLVIVPGGHVHHPPSSGPCFSDATGMRRSMLSMAARLFTMWLAAVLSTLYLTTHCMNGLGPAMERFLAGNRVSRSGVVMPNCWEWPNLCFLLPYFGVPYCWWKLWQTGTKNGWQDCSTVVQCGLILIVVFPFFPPRFAMKTLKTTNSSTSVLGWQPDFLSPKRTFAQQRSLGGVTVRVHEPWSTPWHLCWYRRWSPVPSYSPSSPCLGGVWLNKHGQIFLSLASQMMSWNS